jgi:hypothetical protein
VSCSPGSISQTGTASCTAAGGTSPYSWSVTGISGASLAGSGTRVTFKPNNGTGTASIKVTDAGGNSTTASVSVVALCASLGSATTYNASGSGTTTSPYVLCTTAQLLNLMATQAAWSKSFVLGANIDLTGYNEGNGITPIGYILGCCGQIEQQSVPFTGVFDGNGYSISNYSYDYTGQYSGSAAYVGFFGYVEGPGIVRNLTLANATISTTSSESHIAPLVGLASNGALISNCSASGNATSNVAGGYAEVGGLVGDLIGGAYVVSSSSSVTVNNLSATSGGGTGGLVGGNGGEGFYGAIIDSFATGNVSSGSPSFLGTGGLVGNFPGGIIRNSFATGNVTAPKDGGAGGLVGIGGGTSITNSFATGNVSCTGAGNGGTPCGVLIASVNGTTLTNDYYSSAATCNNTGTQGCTAAGSGAATATLQSSSNAPLSSWDFGYVWKQNSGAFPSLSPQTFDFAAAGGCTANGSGSPFAAGTGSLTHPFIICNAAQLNNLASTSTYWGLGYAFRLASNINLAGYGANFPIGATSGGNVFRGIFDGSGFTIANPSTLLFGQTDVSILHDFSVQNAGLGSGSTPLGAVAMQAQDGAIYDVFATGTAAVTSGSSVGGFVGNAANLSIARSYSTVAVSTTNSGSAIGGLVGSSAGSCNTLRITDAFSLGSITAPGGDTTTGYVTGAYEPAAPCGGNQQYFATNTYYSSASACSGNCDTTGVTGINTSVQTTYFYAPSNAPLSNWDFSTVWTSNAPTALPVLAPSPAAGAAPGWVTSGLVANFDAAKADGGSGPYTPGCSGGQLTWTDLVNAITGTLTGFAGCGATNGWNGTGSPSDPYRLSFDGTTGAYVNLGAPSAFPAGTSARSVCVWARMESTPQTGYEVAFAYGTAAASEAMYIGKASGSTSLDGGGYFQNVYSPSSFWVVGEWNHVCLTYDGTDAVLYANGLQIGSAAENWNLVQDVAVIGQDVDVGAGEYWPGSVSSVMIYDRALQASEVLQNCDALAPRFQGAFCD